MFVKIVTPVPPCSTVSETITQSMSATTVPCVEVATVCKLLSAAFLWIKNSFCFSLQYDVAVRSLTDPSVWTAGYTAVSCDEPSGRCCGGILVPQSDAATGNVTIPCWAPDPRVKFVNIATRAPQCLGHPSAPLMAPRALEGRVSSILSNSARSSDTSAASSAVNEVSPAPSSTPATTIQDFISLDAATHLSHNNFVYIVAAPPLLCQTAACYVAAETCRLLRATFVLAKNNSCVALRCDVAAQSDSGVWTTGFDAVSCDARDGNCCGGHLYSSALASSGSVTFPCWIANTASVTVVEPPPPSCRKKNGSFSLQECLVGRLLTDGGPVAFVFVVLWASTASVAK